jgi:hypothetical protein
MPEKVSESEFIDEINNTAKVIGECLKTMERLTTDLTLLRPDTAISLPEKCSASSIINLLELITFHKHVEEEYHRGDIHYNIVCDKRDKLYTLCVKFINESQYMDALHKKLNELQNS